VENARELLAEARHYRPSALFILAATIGSTGQLSGCSALNSRPACNRATNRFEAPAAGLAGGLSPAYSRGRSDGLLGGALLHDPLVAIEVGEEGHRAPRLVAVARHLLAVLEVDDVAEGSAQLGQLGVDGHDVRHDKG
jgi:hypothetical protein